MKDTKIERCKSVTIKRETPPEKIREDREISAVSTMGRGTGKPRSPYKDMYEYYESNEV